MRVPCNFERRDRWNVCKSCGRRVSGDDDPDSIYAWCKAPAGLGDYVAKAIETIMPWTRKKKCEPCAKRQEKLNELGRRIMG